MVFGKCNKSRLSVMMKVEVHEFEVVDLSLKVKLSKLELIGIGWVTVRIRFLLGFGLWLVLVGL